MKTATRARLNRTTIIRCGMELALADKPDGPVAITGATLGRALGADRSAVWRHFRDRDDLISALHNQMLEPIIDVALARDDPWEKIEAVFQGIVESYRQRPLLGVDTIGISVSGPNWQALSELIVRALGDLGLEPEAAASFFRMFVEVAQSYAAGLASYEMRPEVERERELEGIRSELRSIDSAQYPHLHATGRYLERIEQHEVTVLILKTLRLALDHRQILSVSA